MDIRKLITLAKDRLRLSYNEVITTLHGDTSYYVSEDNNLYIKSLRDVDFRLATEEEFMNFTKINDYLGV